MVSTCRYKKLNIKFRPVLLYFLTAQLNLSGSQNYLIMKKNLSKKEIRQNIEVTLINEIQHMEGSGSSRKVKQVIRKASKDIAAKVKQDIKKNFRTAAKSIRRQTKLSGKSELSPEVGTPGNTVDHNGQQQLLDNNALKDRDASSPNQLQ